MNYLPNGPIERAIAFAQFPNTKSIPQNSIKLILIAAISLIAGGTIMYFFMQSRSETQKANAERNEA
jgi:flagellar basal body-associated protein FliL